LLFPELVHARPYCARVLAAQAAAYRALFSAAAYVVNTAKIYIKA
jgi:hypothetical protein